MRVHAQVLHDGVWELGIPIKLQATDATSDATVTVTATTSTSANSL